ncbi:hypothetical protein AMK26_01505 [Streptomyces sp. CB03234]|nr:hypothetical protein AMK26_01505 [Streptomyces sp. CB03234]
MRSYQCVNLTDYSFMVAKFELDFEALHVRERVSLIQALTDGVERRDGAQIIKSPTSPKGYRRVENDGGLFTAADGSKLLGLGYQAIKLLQIQIVAVQIEAIPGWLRNYHLSSIESQ